MRIRNGFGALEDEDLKPLWDYLGGLNKDQQPESPLLDTFERNEDLQVRQRFRKSERKSDLLANMRVTGEIVDLSTY